jgi:hypothetical protein
MEPFAARGSTDEAAGLGDRDDIRDLLDAFFRDRGALLPRFMLFAGINPIHVVVSHYRLESGINYNVKRLLRDLHGFSQLVDLIEFEQQSGTS